MKIQKIILFVFGFILTYLFLCYCVPSLRIRLDADPLTYFIESIKNSMIFKTIISSIVGLIFSFLPKIISMIK